MGTRRLSVTITLTLGDHPHAYGDKFCPPAHWAVVVGSSPRVWGQVEIAGKKLPKQRIIPTRMGTRPVRGGVKLLLKDHPHAYGDKLAFSSTRIFSRGSSPRVWGQAQQAIGNPSELRIIPTRMGTSFPSAKAPGGVVNHPHAYGDKLRITNNTATRTRSSPRVWGQVHTDTNVLQKRRIIPTRMGTRLRIFRSLDTC